MTAETSVCKAEHAFVYDITNDRMVCKNCLKVQEPMSAMFGSPATSTSVSVPVDPAAKIYLRTKELQEQRAALVAYLQSKMKSNDMHAVQDAGSDIRELDARLDELSRM